VSVYLEVLKVYDDRLKVQTFKLLAGTVKEHAAYRGVGILRIRL